MEAKNPFSISKEKQGAYMKRLENIFNHGKYVMGPEVGELEKKLGEYTNSHCISCGSGTDALVMALRVLGVGPGDAVFVPAYSFVASASCILLVGATPIFVDVAIESFNISPVELEKQILAVKKKSNLKAKAIIAVNLFGVPADYNAINEIAGKHGLYVIEDAAQSFGAKYFGKPSGSLGQIAATSFYPTKPFSCFGDGGALFTQNAEWADKLRLMRNHGINDNGKTEILGLNSRLDSFQAAVLLEKWGEFDEQLAFRKLKALQIHRELKADIPIVYPQISPGIEPSWPALVLYMDNENFGLEQLAEYGLRGKNYYSQILPENSIFSESRSLADDYPVSKKLCNRLVSVPLQISQN